MPWHTLLSLVNAITDGHDGTVDKGSSEFSLILHRTIGFVSLSYALPMKDVEMDIAILRCLHDVLGTLFPVREIDTLWARSSTNMSM